MNCTKFSSSRCVGVIAYSSELVTFDHYDVEIIDAIRLTKALLGTSNSFRKSNIKLKDSLVIDGDKPLPERSITIVCEYRLLFLAWKHGIRKGGT